MDQLKDHPLYRKHNIDSAMSALWDFYKGRFLTLFIVSLVMSGVIQYATILIDLKSLQTITDPALVLAKLKGYIVPFLIIMAISLLFNIILHYYILHKPLDSSANIFRSVYKSLKYYIPYLIIMILFALVGSLAIVLGIFVLVVGMFFAIAWVAMMSFFFLPVMMAEETNIGDTVSRTIRLAHANFWPNMGWTAIFLIIYIIISLILSGLVLLPFAGSFIKTFANPQDTSSIVNLPTDPVFLFLSSAVNALTLPLFPIFAYIMYFNGRAREENLQVSVEPGTSEPGVRVEDLYAKPRDENKFE
ncbi:MAG TPA: hypothetical protein VMT63_02925 [Bacteroidales bacterium]|nr:hypothetical protein [Bacteroidales bacterium]